MKEYKFTTIAEIYEQLTAEQIEICFAELGKSLSILKRAENFNESLFNDLGHKLPPPQLQMPFTWIDDGKTDIDARFDFADGTKLYDLKLRKKEKLESETTGADA